jgi:hypothetical protein
MIINIIIFAKKKEGEGLSIPFPTPMMHVRVLTSMTAFSYFKQSNSTPAFTLGKLIQCLHWIGITDSVRLPALIATVETT